MGSQRERTKISVIEFDLPSYCVKETEMRMVAIVMHMTMPQFFFLYDLTDSSSSSFHCRFIACSWASCLFLSNFFTGTFLHLVSPNRFIHTSSFLLLISWKISFCQYFHWPHHKKKMYTLYLGASFLYEWEWNIYIFH